MIDKLERKIKNIANKLVISGLAGILSFAGSGCLMGDTKARLGCYATSTPGTRFTQLDKLGHHSSSGLSFSEGNGIAYTCRGGHIDVTHLRLAADYTKCVAKKAYDCISNNESGFTFKLPVEPSVHHININYPSNWNYLDKIKKDNVARDMSLKLAPYIAFSATTWHEMLTLKGYKCMAIVPEDASGFSWEDSYSNLLGCLLSVEAMKDTKHSYDEAMTIVINNEMNKLGIQSASFAKNASEKMRGNWFTGNFWVVMKKRNFDVGFDDGFVSPSIVPGLQECNGYEPISYKAPTLDFIKEAGFSMNYYITPHEFEKGNLLKIVYPNGKGKIIEPVKHFPILLKQLEKESLAKGYQIR